MKIGNIKRDLKKRINNNRAKNLQRYFKTRKGEYGEGDIFIGLTSQEIKDVAKKYQDLELNEIKELLLDNIHELRMVALRVLYHQYCKSKDKNKIAKFYIKNAKRVNNWDLVDTSAPHILGDFLLNENRDILYRLAKSDNLWEKRISIISTFAFIRKNDFVDALNISEILLNDSHDLIHKAVGWTLREIGKKDRNTEEKFLEKHYKKMPRTMLRYAIEKFPEELRKKYLRGEI